jgi:hypothetical protein
MLRVPSTRTAGLAILFFALLVLRAPRTLGARGFQAESKSASVSATAPTPHPVLVELFTSEGCSSCPPADALIERMDKSQPITGAQLIVLSEHVDYWDHDGWKDPNSSALLTERQRSYEAPLGQTTAYTPQIVVNGSREIHPNDPQQTFNLLQQAAADLKVPLRITALKIDSANLHAHIEADTNDTNRSADIFFAVALDHVESQVLHGENGGHRLTHVAVVQELRKIGKLSKGKAFAQDVDLKLKPDTDPRNIRVIAFAQEPGPGKLLGATQQKLP